MMMTTTPALPTHKAKILFYSAKPYEIEIFTKLNAELSAEAPFKLTFIEAHLCETTVALAKCYDAVCAFVNDTLDSYVLTALKEQGIQVVAMRCAGYNNVDLVTAEALKLPIVRVPAYSPYAVAEHAVTLLLTLNRKIHKAYSRVREGNFTLDGLVGMDLHGKTVGIVGTGKIGAVFTGIMKGFGCKLLAFDPYKNPEVEALGATYVSLPELLNQSDVISLHCPLMEATHHLINAKTLPQLKRGVLLINTSRGGLVETQAVIEGLKQGIIGGVGLDVYEEEGPLFFEDLSCSVIQDDVFSRLLTFPNVIITGHQAFLTKEALSNIASTTLGNVQAILANQPCGNSVTTG
jgi:D-lactate dehydrogenase